MSTKDTITNIAVINNLIKELRLPLYLTKPQLEHMKSYLYAAPTRAYTGKVCQIAEITYKKRHRTSFGKFLSNSTWNELYVMEEIEEYVVKNIWEVAYRTKKPIYVIIDDTICNKSKPSSQAKRPIQNGSYHMSHKVGKPIYGHQLVCILLQCDNVTIPYIIKRYDKTALNENNQKLTKIDMVIGALKKLPKPPYKGYVLGDSWYSAKKIIKQVKESGFEYIGALKVNRVIYPFENDNSIKINDYAKTLSKEDFHLVTVKNKEYYIHKYTGKINGFNNVNIFITYPKKLFHSAKNLKAFISTFDFQTVETLTSYMDRWRIEVYFRQNKMELGLDNYQVRSEKAIKRFWVLVHIAYIFYALSVTEAFISFGDGLRYARDQFKSHFVNFIIDMAKQGLDNNKILSLLNLPLV